MQPWHRSSRFFYCFFFSVSSCLCGSFCQAAPVKLPNGGKIEEVNFERHVASLLGKMGCNAGACHGSFQGKGGFRLRLFRNSPQQDYDAITRQSMGRRINRDDPDRSLMLLKPTARLPHEGGQRFAKGSWQYEVFRGWIAAGAKWSSGRNRIRRLEVSPQEYLFKQPGESIQLAVTVEFDDDSRADLTPFCDFRIKDDSIVEVSPTGQVRAQEPGDTAIIVSYRGHLTNVRGLVAVPVDQHFAYPSVPQTNYIDREVFAKLRQLNMVPSAVATDAEFLRRITIDTIGCLPAPQEVRAFLADPRPDKRSIKIEELLSHPLHAALWATKLSDITGNNVDVMEDPFELRSKRAKMWHDWLRKRIAENTPYDQIVRGVLCATSRDDKEVQDWMKQELALDAAARKGFESDYAQRPSLDVFWRRVDQNDFFPLEKMAELTATAFLGIRIE